MPEKLPESSLTGEEISAKAKEHIELQEDFAERKGKPFWEEKWEEKRKKDHTPDPAFEKRALNKIREKIARLDEELAALDWSQPKVWEQLETAREAEEKFTVVSKLLDGLKQETESLDREGFALIRARRGRITEVDREVLADIARTRADLTERQEKLATAPETSLFTRMYKLKKYQADLHNGFAETPSVKRDEDWIREQWEQDKAVLLEGPTGTGKTQLAKHLAQKLYPEKLSGFDPVIRCTPRTGPSEIFGRSLLRATDVGGTETYFQSGKYTMAMDLGAPVIFDEFNNMEKSNRLGLKEFFNVKVGQSVILQEDGGKEHSVQEGFVFIATANLKSEKHKDREEFGTEETRTLSVKHIDYLPPAELYDLCLAKMLGKKGDIPITAREGTETLKYLCDAVAEIQNAYDKEIGQHYGLTNAKGVKPKLEKAVLDPGATLGFLTGFEVSQAKGLSLRQHLDKGLLDFVNKRDYPDKDRELIVRILVAKGFLADVPAVDFGLKSLDDKALAPLRPKAQTKTLSTSAEKVQTLTLAQVAELDPYGRRRLAHDKLAEEFLDLAPAGEGGGTTEITEPNPEELKEANENFLKKTFETWYGKAKTQVEQVPRIIDPREQNFATLSGDIQPTKFGEYTINPEMTGVDWESIESEKVKILALPEFVGKPLHEVAQHIVDTYGATHYIPGLEFWKWILEDYDQAPAEAKKKYQPLWPVPQISDTW